MRRTEHISKLERGGVGFKQNVIGALPTSSGICAKNERIITLHRADDRFQVWSCTFCPHLIDGEADGVHVLTVAPVSAPVLLHEGHEEAARHLVVLRVVVLFQQRDLVLWVDPKRVCKRRHNTEGQLQRRALKRRDGGALLRPGTHWGGSCSLRRCCPSSSCHRTWWCSSGWQYPRSERQGSSCRSLGGKIAAWIRWKTSCWV